MESYPIDIYVLELEGGFYYVGKTHYMRRRLDQHRREGIGGSEWTKLHPPVKMAERHTFYVENEYDEDRHENSVTIKIMERYGWQRVRGGVWCEVSEANTLVKLHREGFFRNVRRRDVAFTATTYSRFTLKLGGRKYYVGYARDVDRTLAQYRRGKAPAWVLEHGYVKPLNITEFECEDGIINNKRDLDPTVIECFKRYGNENVRGGSFSCADLDRHHEKLIKHGIIEGEIPEITTIKSIPMKTKVKQNLTFSTADSPFGELVVFADVDGGIVAVEFVDADNFDGSDGFVHDGVRCERGDASVAQRVVELFLAGETPNVLTLDSTAALPTNLGGSLSSGSNSLVAEVGGVVLRPAGTAFQQKVWRALMEVPFGKTVSYSELSTAAGCGRAVRAVASAVARNPISLFVPCHRVVRSDGSVGEYHWGPDRKAAILAWEKKVIR